MISAREDFPYAERHNMHVFESTIESMKAQSMKNIELVVVDALWHKRKDYFKDKTWIFLLNMFQLNLTFGLKKARQEYAGNTIKR